jgi:hypothetical protein
MISILSDGQLTCANDAIKVISTGCSINDQPGSFDSIDHLTLSCPFFFFWVILYMEGLTIHMSLFEFLWID